MNQKKEKIRVIIIDPSSVTRYLLTEILEQSDDIEVLASVYDPAEALNKIRDLRPNVVTLDFSMSDLNGLAFLEQLKAFHPTPVVIISAMTKNHSDTVAKAMELGAVGYVVRQPSQSWGGILSIADEIVEKVRTASAKQFLINIILGGLATAGIF